MMPLTIFCVVVPFVLAHQVFAQGKGLDSKIGANVMVTLNRAAGLRQTPQANDKPSSRIDPETMEKHHLTTVKLRVENGSLISMWVIVNSTEIKIDFVTDSNSIWDDNYIFIAKGAKNSSMHVQSYSKKCHYTSTTPSVQAKVSNCDGLLTGVVIIKNEMFVLDPASLRKVDLIRAYNRSKNATGSKKVVLNKEAGKTEKTSTSTATVTTTASRKNITDLPFRQPPTVVPTNLNKSDELVSTVASKTEEPTYFLVLKNEEADPEEIEWHHKDAPLVTHVVRKRSVKNPLDKSTKSTFCGVSNLETVNIDSGEYEAVMANPRNFDYVRNNRELYMELAVFVDNALWKRYEKNFGSLANTQLQDFITSTLNNAQLMYLHDSIVPKIRFKVVRYEVFTSQPYELNVNPDAQTYLNAFCHYQYRLRASDTSWDQALLLTGHDLTRWGWDRSISGMARLNGVCNPPNSCLVAEAFDFNAAFILAHEIGHSLGMYHDEPTCESSFIMSRSLGAGKVVWSDCSVNSLQKYLNMLDYENRNCLLSLSQYKEPKIELKTTDLPGQRYDANKQCSLMYGPDYYKANYVHDMCKMIYCQHKNGGNYLTSHPALEGTSCESGKQCANGKCLFAYQRSIEYPVHGGWSGWSQAQCYVCQCPSIINSLAAVRSTRACNNPPARAGGSHCSGSNIRGVVCNRSCPRSIQTQTPDEYVASVCLGKKSQNEFKNLVGTGRQMTLYEHRACQVFCDVYEGSAIVKKTWGDLLPDGTPCGNGKYCLNGKCLFLGCDSTALVATESDCSEDKDRCLHPLSKERVVWTGWSGWSACSTTCGQGIKTRARSCVTTGGSATSSLTTGCPGHDGEKNTCQVTPCPPSKESYDTKIKSPKNWWYEAYSEYGSWGHWSPCSVTCGEGRQIRYRSCSQGGRCFGPSEQERFCYPEACTAWGGWGFWSTCDMGGRLRRRIRKCYGPETCPGSEMDVENC